VRVRVRVRVRNLEIGKRNREHGRWNMELGI